jgi:hypothetical protein
MAQWHRLVQRGSAFAPSGTAERSMIELVVRGHERTWTLFRLPRTEKNKCKYPAVGKQGAAHRSSLTSGIVAQRAAEGNKPWSHKLTESYVAPDRSMHLR